MDAGESSFFVPEVPHFFKVMLDEDIKTGKLIVPKKFVRKYGTNLCKSNNVLLKVPTGDTWEVELRETDGVVRLEKGWPEFLNFYTIEHGDFLMFRYESGSSNELDVVMCNKTCTEVEYQKKSRVNVPPIKVEDSGEDDVPAEEARGCQPPRRMTRRTTPLRTRSLPSRRVTRSTARGRTRNHPARQDTVISRDSSPSRLDDPTERTPQAETDTLNRKKKGKTPSSSREETRAPLRGTERAKALDRAKSFRSTNPYFLVVMQPYYIRRSLNVPIEFAKQYLGRRAFGEMKLHISGDEIWNAGYMITEGSGKESAKVVRGWKKFVKDNGLVRGDVYAFELMKGLKSISFKITIFGAPRLPTSRSSQSRAQPAPLFVSEHPFFQVVVKESYLSRGKMHIPIGFMRDHLSLECKEWAATLKFGRSSLLVKLIMTCHSSKRKAFLSGGFAAFRKKNSLEAGDTCTFELIQRAEMVFRVSVSKADREA